MGRVVHEDDVVELARRVAVGEITTEEAQRALEVLAEEDR